MVILLSLKPSKAIEKLFPDESKDEAVRLLAEKCANNATYSTDISHIHAFKVNIFT